MIFDQYHDPAHAILLKNCNESPAFEAAVKTAQINFDEEPSLPETAFAWPEQRRFPIHTRESAILSAGYVKFASEREVPAEVYKALQDALTVYEVDPAIFGNQSYTKVASESPMEYALPMIKKLPINDASQCKLAEESLLTQARYLTTAQRNEAAGNLYKKAEALGLKLNPTVLKLAGVVETNTNELVRWIEARNTVVKDAAVREGFDVLADGLRHRAKKLMTDEAMKIAAVITELDDKAGIKHLYGKTVPDPMTTVFNTDKIAEEEVDLGGGHFVSAKKLAGMPSTFWDDMGCPEIYKEASSGGSVDQAKMAALVDTLPLDLKVILRHQVR